MFTAANGVVNRSKETVPVEGFCHVLSCNALKQLKVLAFAPVVAIQEIRGFGNWLGKLMTTPGSRKHFGFHDEHFNIYCKTFDKTFRKIMSQSYRFLPNADWQFACTDLAGGTICTPLQNYLDKG